MTKSKINFNSTINKIINKIEKFEKDKISLTAKCISESDMVSLMENTPFVYVPSEKQGALLHGASLNACKGFEKIYHNMGYYDAFCRY